MPRPRHRGNDHTMPRATYPRRRRLQIQPSPTRSSTDTPTYAVASSTAPRPDPPPPPPRTDSTDTVVFALTSQVNQLKSQHRQEVQALRAAPEQAHGENLELRRELARRGWTGHPANRP
jgi:hypothetical protein